MEKSPWPKSVLLVIFLIMASSGWTWRWPAGGAEARGQFECPRMIDCNSVCQGFPNCCVDGRCICQPCSTLPPPQPGRSLSCHAGDQNCRH